MSHYKLGSRDEIVKIEYLSQLRHVCEGILIFLMAAVVQHCSGQGTSTRASQIETLICEKCVWHIWWNEAMWRLLLSSKCSQNIRAKKPFIRLMYLQFLQEWWYALLSSPANNSHAYDSSRHWSMVLFIVMVVQACQCRFNPMHGHLKFYKWLHATQSVNLYST